MADEGDSPDPFGCPLGLDELRGAVVGAANVAHLPRPHKAVEDRHCLLVRSVRVGQVTLVEVDIVGAQPAQAGLQGLGQVRPGQPLVVRAGALWLAALGSQHHLFAAALQCDPDNLLRWCATAATRSRVPSSPNVLLVVMLEPSAFS